MPTKSATKSAPKTSEKTAAPKPTVAKYDDGPLREEIANVKEAVRRLASGAVVTEEQRDELFDLLGGK